jgi:hypothetical protein
MSSHFPERDAAIRAFQKRRATQRQTEGSHAKDRSAAPNPPVDKSSRDPVFEELDRRIAEEDDQARRRVRRAEANSEPAALPSPSE